MVKNNLNQNPIYTVNRSHCVEGLLNKMAYTYIDQHALSDLSSCHVRTLRAILGKEIDIRTRNPVEIQKSDEIVFVGTKFRNQNLIYHSFIARDDGETAFDCFSAYGQYQPEKLTYTYPEIGKCGVFCRISVAEFYNQYVKKFQDVFNQTFH